MINAKIPTFEEMRLPDVFKQLAMKPRGLVLVTGPTGSGKTTTLAAMTGYINENRKCHILTIEEPIEYMHRHNKSLVNQREVGGDTQSFAKALRSALREDPDVILVGEMRDLETISTAISASETGHFVMSTLHTTTAAQTVDRIIDAFPPYQQQQMRSQLSTILEGIICQQLIRTVDGTEIVPAFEILLVNDAVRNLIREGKTHQIDTILQTNIKKGMMPMDYSLAQLTKKHVISLEDAIARCVDREIFNRYMSGEY
jgi:twitching motility protein PilT